MSIVYLDGASNTPLSRAAAKAMAPYLSPNWVGNSMSTHAVGVAASLAIFEARIRMANILGVTPEQLFFTSGASESNNWVIKSVAAAYRKQHPTGGHIICSALEHDSVIRACEQVGELFGYEISWIRPLRREECSMTLDDVMKVARSETFLICAMAVNNELGTTNPINDITAYANTHGIQTLVDCTQALGYGGKSLAIGTEWPEATFMSFSAHKIYGPTGVGALIARAPLEPLIAGGAQENGQRGGTHNTAGIIGMAAALEELAGQDWSAHYHRLVMYLNEQLGKKLPGAYLTVWPTHYTIANVNCSNIINVSNLAAMLDCEGIAVSAGSACDATHNELEGEFNGSHVLRAIGLAEHEIRNTIRLSFTRTTTLRDIDKFIRALSAQVKFCAEGANDADD